MSNDSKEIGRVGQRRYGGIFYEEFLSELRGRKGAEVFTEMSNNDETIGAILFAIRILTMDLQEQISSARPLPV